MLRGSHLFRGARIVDYGCDRMHVLPGDETCAVDLRHRWAVKPFHLISSGNVWLRLELFRRCLRRCGRLWNRRLLARLLLGGGWLGCRRLGRRRLGFRLRLSWRLLGWRSFGLRLLGWGRGLLLILRLILLLLILLLWRWIALRRSGCRSLVLAQRSGCKEQKRSKYVSHSPPA